MIETSSAFPQGLCSLPLIISTDITLWNNSEGQMTMHCSTCSLAYPSPYLSSIILFWPYCGCLYINTSFAFYLCFRCYLDNIIFPFLWNMEGWECGRPLPLGEWYITLRNHVGICSNLLSSVTQLILLFSL